MRKPAKDSADSINAVAGMCHLVSRYELDVLACASGIFTIDVNFQQQSWETGLTRPGTSEHGRDQLKVPKDLVYALEWYFARSIPRGRQIWPTLPRTGMCQFFCTLQCNLHVVDVCVYKCACVCPAESS